MDEMTIDRELREFRADAPGIDPSADVRIRGAIAAAPTGGARPSRRTWWAVAASAAAVVGVVTVTGVLHTGSEIQPSGPGLLDGVASQVAAQPAPPKPRDDQWVFRDVVSSQFDRPAGATPPIWVRFDGKQSATRDENEPIQVQDLLGPGPTLKRWYDEMADLPEDPGVLLAKLRSNDLAEEKGATRAERDYDGVVTALSEAWVLPPSARARLLRALGTIPGVGLDRNAAPDLVGRPVLAVTFTGDGSDDHEESIPFRHKSELLLDPQTYAVRGSRLTALEDPEHPVAKVPPVTDGEVFTTDTIVRSGVVDAPGSFR